MIDRIRLCQALGLRVKQKGSNSETAKASSVSKDAILNALRKSEEEKESFRDLLKTASKGNPTWE